MNREKTKKSKLTSRLIAPCGMNCGLCMAYLRKKNHCHGCNDIQKNAAKTRFRCRLRICKKRKGKYCYQCDDFPCARLKHLDKRYRTRYGMSEIDNLMYIKKCGIQTLLAREERRWQCKKCGNMICVHNKRCYFCERE